jgi:hypothetical protein
MSYQNIDATLSAADLLVSQELCKGRKTRSWGRN